MQIIINNKKYTLFATKNKKETEIKGILKDNKKIKINDLLSSNKTQIYKKGDKKMKIYIVYQLGYNGSNVLEILGAYGNYKKAEKIYLQNINNNIDDYDYGVDEECDDRIFELTHRMTRLFKGGYQENWDNYLEIHMKEVEVF